MVLMLVAILCGLAAALLVNNLKAKANVQMESVLVAATDLPAGAKIDDPKLMFVAKEFLKGTSPPGSYEADNEAEKATMLGKRLMVSLPKGEAVTKKHLEDIYITKSLPDGYRAMTVPVRIDTAGAGFILPNSRVDLITTFNREAGGVVAQIFLQDVQVLAINTETQRPQEGQPTMPNPTTATLAVKQEDAGRVMLAKRLGGEIVMVLRKPGDTIIEKDKNKLTLSTMLNSGKEEDKTEKVLVAKAEIAQGTKVDKELFVEKEVPEKTYDEAIFVKSLSDPMLAEGRIIAVPLKSGTPVAKSFLASVADTTPKTAKPDPVHVLRIYNGNKDPIEAKFTMSEGKAVSSGRETTPMPGTSGVPGSEGK
jgi:Flp pilus assembly protein CpaB